MNSRQLTDSLNRFSNFRRAQLLRDALTQNGAIAMPKELSRLQLRNIAIWRMGSSHECPARIARADEQFCRIVTRAALEFRHSNIEIETTGRIRLLRCVDGMTLSIGTTLLGLLEPDRHCVLNARGWNQLHLAGRLEMAAPARFDSEDQYFLYRESMLKYATELGSEWTAFRVDRALWAKDTLEEPERRSAEMLQHQ